MAKELEVEANADEEEHEAFQCWCKTNTRQKAKAIDDNGDKVSQLQEAYRSLKSDTGRIDEELEALTKEKTQSQKALESALDMRKKQLAEFTVDEKELMASIASLESAKATIAGSGPEAMLQGSDTAESVAQALKRSLKLHTGLVLPPLSEAQLRATWDFLHSPSAFLGAAEAPDAGGAPPRAHRAAAETTGEETWAGARQGVRGGAAWSWSEFALMQRAHLADEAAAHSGARGASAPVEMLRGIIGSMRDSFGKHLTQAQQDEDKNGREFMNLKKTKKQVIRRTQEQIEQKAQEVADLKVKAARTREDMDDTQAILDSDRVALPQIAKKCKTLEAEYVDRVESRQQEVEAVRQALTFLASDEARDLFSRTTGAAMIQRRMESTATSRVSAYLVALGRRIGDPHFSLVALGLKSGIADKIKANMVKMIDNLVVKKGNDMIKKDFCTDEINKNERAWERKGREIELNTEKEGSVSASLTETLGEIKAGEAQKAEDQVSLKRAGEDRQQANTMFQRTVRDHNAAAALLTKALTVLKAFYEKANKEASMLRTHSRMESAVRAIPVGPAAAPTAPPHKFELGDLSQTVARDLQVIKAKPMMLRVSAVLGTTGSQREAQRLSETAEKMRAGGPVIKMLETIIGETKALIHEATQGELEAQQAYEDFVTELNEGTKVLDRTLVDLRETSAKLRIERSNLKMEERELRAQWKEYRQKDIDLHGVEGCDWLMRNYDIRQQAYAEEIEGLKVGMYALGDMEGLNNVMGQLPPEHAPPAEGEQSPDELQPASEGETTGSEVAVVPEGLEITGPEAEHAVLSTR